MLKWFENTQSEEGAALPRFFIDGAPAGDTIEIAGEDAHHIARVLRMKPGETLTVCDGAGADYRCTLTGTDGGRALCHVEARTPSRGEPNVRLTLYMALPKGDKMDLIVQKAVELGAFRVVPYAAARSVSRPDAKALQKKTARWRKIAREAAQQSGRGRVPEVADCLSFAEAVRLAGQSELPLLLYENEQENSLRAALTAHPFAEAALMVGPEGGFAGEEVQAACAAGLASVSLGPRILRCETAPLAALAAVLYESGNL